MKLAATLAILATIALGGVLGVLYLRRVRRKRWADAHLIAALVASALALALLVTAPAQGDGPPALLPPLLLAAATALGWGAGRIARGRRGLHDGVIAAHLIIGIAGFFVFLAWAKGFQP
jgi:hypothetical protein